ncbi:MAG: NAD(P)/FAD-dependent oxidoreductase [Solirubrobacterales bacterium]
MDYDVLILGGGIVGCAAAYELSKHSLNIALIEKDYDVADDVAIINSAIVYDGSECEDTLMAKLEAMGSSMMAEITTKFNIPYKNCGYIIIGQDEATGKRIDEMYNRAVSRGIKNIQVITGEDVNRMEPKLNIKVEKALYTKNTAIISPYDLAIAYGEVAFDNGVNFKLEEEVIDIKKINKGFKVITNKNKFTCNMVINTTPNEAFSIDASQRVETDNCSREYFMLDKRMPLKLNSVITTLDNSKDMTYIIPTLQGNTAILSISEGAPDYKTSLEKVSMTVGNISESDINSYICAEFFRNPIIIDDSLIDQGYIKVTGKHYGEVTMTPAIAKIVCETIVSNINCVPKKNFMDKRRDFYRFKDMNNKERNEIIKVNKSYGKIVCSCNCVSEGEIIDAIRRPLGARTLEGISRRTGTMCGDCNGARCLTKIARILSRETGKRINEIVKDSKDSKLMPSRIKEFEHM